MPALRTRPRRASGAVYGLKCRRGVYPSADALQGCPVVRRAEEDEAAQTARPPVARGRAVVVSTARNETAQTVGDDRKLFQRRGPLSDKVFDQVGKCPAVGGDVQTAVVVQVDHGVAQVASQRLSRGCAPSGSIAGGSCRGRGPGAPVSGRVGGLCGAGAWEWRAGCWLPPGSRPWRRSARPARHRVRPSSPVRSAWV